MYGFPEEVADEKNGWVTEPSGVSEGAWYVLPLSVIGARLLTDTAENGDSRGRIGLVTVLGRGTSS
jgi:hypothetical protein